MSTESNLFQEITLDEATRILKKANLKTEGYDLKILNGGLFNTTYLVEYSDEIKYVLRLGPINRHLLPEYENNLMEAETYVYKLCKDKSIPCSTVLICDTSKELINRDYMIIDYIDSVSLAQSGLSNEEKQNIYREVGSYMKEFHSIRGNCFGRVSHILAGRCFETWYDYIIYEVSDVLQKGKRYGLWDEKYEKTIIEFFIRYKSLLNTVKTPSLIHADVWEGNVLIKDKKCVAIIDPDRAIFGDVELEFASPWMINEKFKEGYGEIPKAQNWEIKQKLYQVFFLIIDAYAWSAEYNIEQNTRDNLIKINDILQS